MSDRLPPLTALRAFEAAARHMSFARAADELHVTPAALSYQIKALEDHLGVPVFRRLNRAVELTDAGRALVPGTRDGFLALQAAWSAARRMVDDKTLTVTAGPAFTAKWLAPRLFPFARAHPEIELRFSATLRLLDLDRDAIDVAIRFGLPDGDDRLYSRAFISEWMTPMVAPDLARQLSEPRDLLEIPLLHQEDIDFLRPRPDWGAWFHAAGLGGQPHGGPRFSQADHAIDAAIAGAGAVLGRISLTEGALREGRLVAPFPLALRLRAGYRILCPSGSERRPKVRAFLDWLRAEAEPLADWESQMVFVDHGDVA